MKKQSKCFICLSPYRKEVVSLRNQGISYARIWRKYAVLMNYSATTQAFALILGNHIRSKHKSDAILIPGEGTPRIIKNATVESFAQRMLELGIAKVDGMTPETTQLKDVISAQKLLIESKKLKLNEGEFAITMAKMFAPPMAPIEGELVE